MGAREWFMRSAAIDLAICAAFTATPATWPMVQAEMGTPQTTRDTMKGV